MEQRALLPPTPAMITDQQKKLVQSSWAKVVPTSDKAARMFYDRLFELDPSLRNLFTRDMEQQGQKLMKTMSVVVKGLLHLEALVPAVQELGRRHMEYGVLTDHYGTVGEALMWTLHQSLDQDFTPEVQEAWVDTYSLLASIMRTAEGPTPVGAMA
jgi:hemoglobin-like flavoprotein